MASTNVWFGKSRTILAPRTRESLANDAKELTASIKVVLFFFFFVFCWANRCSRCVQLKLGWAVTFDTTIQQLSAKVEANRRLFSVSDKRSLCLLAPT